MAEEDVTPPRVDPDTKMDVFLDELYSRFPEMRTRLPNMERPHVPTLTRAAELRTIATLLQDELDAIQRDRQFHAALVGSERNTDRLGILNERGNSLRALQRSFFCLLAERGWNESE